MTCKQDPPRLASATGLLLFSFSRHRNSERQLFEVSQIVIYGLVSFAKIFTLASILGNRVINTCLFMNFFALFFVSTASKSLLSPLPPHPWFNVVDITRNRLSFFINIVWGGGVACERRRISVRRLGKGVGERNESAPVRSFHPYPPPQIPILAPRGAHTYAQRVGVNRLLVRSPVPGRLSGYGK